MKKETQLTAARPMVMVDIETWGGAPYGAITQIGAVKFNLFGAEFVRDIWRADVDIHSSVKAGAKIEVSTVQWWMKQDEAVRLTQYEQSNPVPLEFALQLFDEWCGDCLVVANPAMFDLAIIDNARILAGLKITTVPWWDATDMQSMIRAWQTVCPALTHEAIEDCKFAAVNDQENEHDPVADAAYQARCLQNIYAFVIREVG